jgi:hypothetical protein
MRHDKTQLSLSELFVEPLVETHTYTDGVDNDVEPGVRYYEYPNDAAYVALLLEGGSPLR